MGFTCFTSWIQVIDQHHEQQEQDACKQSAHALLPKVCPKVTEHTQRYVFKNDLINVQQWMDVSSIRKKDKIDVILLWNFSFGKKTRGGKQAEKVRTGVATSQT